MTPPSRPLTRREFSLALATPLLFGAAGLRRFAAQPTYALVLGSAQDGGLPQAGCYSPRCERARTQPRFVASLALIQPDAQRYYLVDASPDLIRQLDLITDPAFKRRAESRRPFDAIFLTHAHIGHYLGLALLGREGLGMAPTRCYCSPSMAQYLTRNGPWSLLVSEGRLTFPPLEFDRWTPVDDGLSVRILAVPHRKEFSDTVAFQFRGPRRSLLYLPDIDRWETWERRIEDIVQETDVAMLDATFYSASELPGRSIEEIPHPLVPVTMDRLQAAVGQGRRVVFTHLNNTNPALDEDSPEAREVRRRGFEVAKEGMRIEL